jgi:voltage-dependent potassium channel beta subunit
MVEKDTMEYRHLGSAGVKVSALSFGNWLSGHSPDAAEASYQCIAKSIEAGVNFIDTAEIYGFGQAETHIGNVLKRGGWDRDSLVISTKFYMSGKGVNQSGLGRKRLVQAARNSLKRLQLDYVDIIFAHRPDYVTPLEESVRTFNHLIETGKADYWGTSEFTAQELMEVYALCEKHGYYFPVVEQPQYNMLWRERVEVELGPLYDQYGLGTTIWSPLAGGILSGKYNDGSIPEGSRYGDPNLIPMVKKRFTSMFEGPARDKTIATLGGLKAIADELGCTQSQLALAWTVKNKDVSTAIFGATREDQVVDNLGALEVVHKLTPEILARIEDLLGNKPQTSLNWRTWTPQPSRR